MAFTYPNYQTDPYVGETEEQRRRRLALEQAQAQAQDQENGLSQRNPDPGFGDIARQAFDVRMGGVQDRINQAGQMFSDPRAALQQRLGVPAANQPAAEEPTPVKQTITTNPDTGEQTVKIEGSARDLSAANPLTPTVIGPVAPQQQAVQDQQFAQQMAQYRAPQAQARTQAPPPVPAQLPAQGPISPQMAQMPVPQPQLPQPGPGVQVATAAPGMGVQPPRPGQAPAPALIPGLPSLAQMGAQAQAAPSQAPAWIDAANTAGNDFNKLLDVASKFPESRDAIQEKLKASFANKTKEDEANKLFKDAAAGDIKAQNKVFQMIKPETGKPKEEVTTGDYVRAYMYKRLGLDALAQDVQNKIIGKETKFGQISIGNSNWQVETDPSGQIVRAKDDEGNVATTAILNKLRAAGQKFGGQIYSSTGGAITIPAGQPDAGEEYRQVFNSTTGKYENQITTGANAGNVYKGPAGLERRVATNAAVALNDAYIKFQTQPTTAMATEILKAAALVDDGQNGALEKARATIAQRSPQIYNEVKNTLPSTGGQPNIAGAPTASYVNPPGTAAADPAAARRAQGDVESLTREIALAKSKPFGTAQQQAGRLQYLNDEMAKAQQRVQQSGGGTKSTPAVGGGGSLTTQRAQQEANVQAAKEIAVAEAKPVAEAKGKITAKDINNQQFANSTYDLVKPIADLIKKSTGSGIGVGVDKLAGLIGSSSTGAEAIAELEVLTYPLISNVPRFEGPQGVRDVELYERAAGDLSNASKPVKVRLAALNAMITMLKKYDKEGSNDWTFGGSAGGSEKVIDGVTYVNDGKGWKKK